MSDLELCEVCDRVKSDHNDHSPYATHQYRLKPPGSVVPIEDEIAKLSSEVPADAWDEVPTNLSAEFCRWTFDGLVSMWAASCGHKHEYIDAGSPDSTNYTFCPYCGKRIEEAK